MESYDASTMGNWHHDIRINDDVRTSHLSDPHHHAFVCKESLAAQFNAAYNHQLHNKNVLDVACNAGGHLFALNQHRIKYGYGFDARQMWINQAHWVQRNIDDDASNLTFETGSFELLQQFPNKHFHITMFNGIFYHLPDPIAALQQVAAKTSEIICINTSFVHQIDAMPALVLKHECTDHALSGLHHLSWLPNGEQVIINIMQHLQFKHCKTLFKDHHHMRMCIIASTDAALIRNF